MAKLLILEQHANLQDLYQLQLAENGHEVFTVADEHESWNRIPEVPPDMIVMDTLLNEEEGAMWLRARKARFGNIPMVLFSCRQMQEKEPGEEGGIPLVFKSSNLALSKQTISNTLRPTAVSSDRTIGV